MGLRRSSMAVLLIGAAVMAAATPARTASAETVTQDRATVTSPPDFPTYSVELVRVDAIDVASLRFQHSDSIRRDTGMAKVLSLDSLVRVDAVASVDSLSQVLGLRQRHVNVSDTTRLHHDSVSTGLPSSAYRSTTVARMRHAAIVHNYLTAQSASNRRRILGLNAFPLYL